MTCQRCNLPLVQRVRGAELCMDCAANLISREAVGDGDAYQTPSCSMCGTGLMMFIGMLANRACFRCRSCGWDSGAPKDL